MARDLNPKCKYCRREGVKLFLKGDRCNSAKCAIVRRNYPPGAHGPKGLKRLTGYGRQLREKQKLKRIYGILEKQLCIYFDKSVLQKGDSGENLIRFLELRLDNIVYKLGFAPSRNQARQLVGHGHFLINDKKVNIPSYQLKINDTITLKKASREMSQFSNLEKKLQTSDIPTWLALDPREFKGTVISEPTSNDLKKGFDIKTVVEFYSR